MLTDFLAELDPCVALDVIDDLSDTHGAALVAHPAISPVDRRLGPALRRTSLLRAWLGRPDLDADALAVALTGGWIGAGHLSTLSVDHHPAIDDLNGRDDLDLVLDALLPARETMLSTACTLLQRLTLTVPQRRLLVGAVLTSRHVHASPKQLRWLVAAAGVDPDDALNGDVADRLHLPVRASRPLTYDDIDVLDRMDDDVWWFAEDTQILLADDVRVAACHPLDPYFRTYQPDDGTRILLRALEGDHSMDGVAGSPEVNFLGSDVLADIFANVDSLTVNAPRDLARDLQPGTPIAVGYRRAIDVAGDRRRTELLDGLAAAAAGRGTRPTPRAMLIHPAVAGHLTVSDAASAVLSDGKGARWLLPWLRHWWRDRMPADPDLITVIARTSMSWCRLDDLLAVTRAVR